MIMTTMDIVIVVLIVLVAVIVSWFLINIRITFKKHRDKEDKKDEKNNC